jgi:dihydroxyacetone kinase-like predicted kinase
MFAHNYSLKFFLQAHDADAAAICNALRDIGEDVVVTAGQTADRPGTFEVQLFTRDPALVFDVCGQFGRIQSVRIDEVN